MSFHQNLQAQYPSAVVSQCSKNNCRLDLTLLPSPQTILDCDGYKQHYGHGHVGRICDFLIFWSSSALGAAAVEMKARAWKASEVEQQLQAGAELINRLAGAQWVAEFQPVLVSEGARSRAEVNEFLNKRVAFRGRRFRIIRKRCGEKLEP
jgi:hypothetical protein